MYMFQNDLIEMFWIYMRSGLITMKWIYLYKFLNRFWRFIMNTHVCVVSWETGLKLPTVHHGNLHVLTCPIWRTGYYLLRWWIHIILYKRNDFCDFLFSFPHTKSDWKRISSKGKEFSPTGSKFFPFRVAPFFQKRGKSVLTELLLWMCINSLNMKLETRQTKQKTKNKKINK